MNMLQQFNELKAKHPDAILLFRCGDFYETYCGDAETASRVLGITLMIRNSDKTKMAGFPFHALDAYLPKLIRAGLRVTICDQLDKPNEREQAKLQEPRNVALPRISKSQYELLCECIRYRAADNDKERADAIAHGRVNTAYYDGLDQRLSELKNLFYNIK